VCLVAQNPYNTQSGTDHVFIKLNEINSISNLKWTMLLNEFKGYVF